MSEKVAVLVRDPDRMAEVAAGTMSTDMFGDRWFPIVFFPYTATLGQMMDALNWPKSYEFDVWCDPPVLDGVTVECRVKGSYLGSLIDATLAAGGAFVSIEQQEMP